MERDWLIGAQLSTSHSAIGGSSVSQALSAVSRVTSEIGLDLLIVGAREVPEVFDALTERHARPVEQIYLWYNLLSDVPGFDNQDLVVNWRGERSRGWGGWSEQNPDVQETFRFGCPNNPDTRRKTLSEIGRLLDRYPFEGIFLDKMRFPSPANGADEMVSCFCEHCRDAAAEAGVDLDEVADVFRSDKIGGQVRSDARMTPGGWWPENVFVDSSPLTAFLKFREDSVTRIVREAGAEARARGRKVALDLFSPTLGPVVGQDYRELRACADWVKPMTYRVARGPASLRLEIPALIENIATLSAAPRADIARWCTAHVERLGAGAFDAFERAGVPFAVVRDEIALAVERMGSVPVYFGLELIHYPGSIEITPADVVGAVSAGRSANAAGAIISWDVAHAPPDGLKALAEQL